MPNVPEDKSLYPDAEVIKAGEWQNEVRDASALYESYSQRLKAGRFPIIDPHPALALEGRGGKRKFMLDPVLSPRGRGLG